MGKKQKKERVALVITVFLGILSFFSTLIIWLGLSDISKDYASSKLWTDAGKEFPKWFADWVNCSGEWIMVQICWIIIVAFHISLIITVLTHKKAGKIRIRF